MTTKVRVLPPETVIHPDEKVWQLTEMTEIVPGLPGRRRLQRTYVIRADELAVWVKDLGDADEIGVPDFRVLSLMEHTAGEIWDMADFDRNQNEYFTNRLREVQDESTLIPDAIDWMQAREKLVQNQSHFGPEVTIQRNGLSIAGVQEALKKERSQ